jgi:hypothetical protein
MVASATIHEIVVISFRICKTKKVNRTGFVGDFLFKLGHLT